MPGAVSPSPFRVDESPNYSHAGRRVYELQLLSCVGPCARATGCAQRPPLFAKELQEWLHSAFEPQTGMSLSQKKRGIRVSGLRAFFWPKRKKEVNREE